MSEMLSPLKSIRRKCMDCCCQNPAEVRICPNRDCPLWHLKMGKNPARKGIGGKRILENNSSSQITQ